MLVAELYTDDLMPLSPAGVFCYMFLAEMP